MKILVISDRKYSLSRRFEKDRLCKKNREKLLYQFFLLILNDLSYGANAYIDI